MKKISDVYKLLNDLKRTSFTMNLMEDLWKEEEDKQINYGSSYFKNIENTYKSLVEAVGKEKVDFLIKNENTWVDEKTLNKYLHNK